MLIGKLIRTARQARGISIVSLSQSSGVSVRTIKAYESGGVKNPSFAITAKIAKAMNIDLNQLAEMVIENG